MLQVYKIVIASFICSLMYFSLIAQTKAESLLEMQVEISLLQKQLKELEKQAHGAHRQEMVEELYSQRNLRSYAWSSFSQHLENAESSEEKARHDEQLIQAIKARLNALEKQISQLQSN